MSRWVFFSLTIKFKFENLHKDPARVALVRGNSETCSSAEGSANKSIQGEKGWNYKNNFHDLVSFTKFISLYFRYGIYIICCIKNNFLLSIFSDDLLFYLVTILANVTVMYPSFGYLYSFVAVSMWFSLRFFGEKPMQK